MPTNSINQSRVVDIDVNSKNSSDLMDATKSSEEFVTALGPESLVELDGQIYCLSRYCLKLLLSCQN